MRWLQCHGQAIQKLEISTCWPQHPNCAAGLLAQLPQLKGLEFTAWPSSLFADAQFCYLSSLTGLQSIHITLNDAEFWPEEALVPLARLSGSHTLDLCIQGGIDKPFVVPSCLSALTQLSRLTLFSWAITAAHDRQSRPVMSTIQHMTRLMLLHLSGMLDHIPDELSKLTGLADLALQQFPEDSASFQTLDVLVWGLACCELPDAFLPA